jgi:hypothetical protein
MSHPAEPVNPVTFTHKGWFGLCPVYFSGIESEGPVIDPRREWMNPLMGFSEILFAAYIFVRTMIDVTYEPGWPLLVTGELDQPIMKVFQS